MTILAKLKDLRKQATTERSHYYVGSVCQEAANEITKLRAKIKRQKLEIQNWRAVAWRP